MPDPTLLSPNTGNLQVGKGIVSFKKEGDADYRDLGNVAELTLSPDMTTLEHFTSRAGTKTKDLVIILEKKASLKMTMEEFTPANVAIMLLGDVDEDAVGGPEVSIFSENAVTGALRFVGTNEVGPKITIDLYNVTFTPTGDMGFISDEFGQMEATGDVLAKSGTPPVYATGTLTGTDQPEDGDTVVLGGQSYTWKDTLTATPGQVKIGASLLVSLQNLRKAINLSGVAGTDYGTGTVINPLANATGSDATHLYVTADDPGVAGNTVGSTKTGTSLTWGGAILSGGVDNELNAGKIGVAKWTNLAA